MLIAHEGLVTLTEGLCYILEIAKNISKVLEEAVFAFRSYLMHQTLHSGLHLIKNNKSS